MTFTKGTNKDRVSGIIYAHDTICIAQDEQAMNKRLASIEKQGKTYVLRLNTNSVLIFTFWRRRTCPVFGRGMGSKDECLGCL